ncbi:MAG: hypothetical protein HZB16_01310 [Armatimonadetes bacterium]|nr:hypothetical protein [Armatimonadota bacterium]
MAETTTRRRRSTSGNAATGIYELTGGWATSTPYNLLSSDVELAVEHLPDGLAVTAPVGWRVHVPTHSGVRYVHVPEGWSSIEPLATQCVIVENGETFVNLTYREPDYVPGHLEISSERSRVHLRWQFGGSQVPCFHCLSFSSWDDLINEHRAWLTSVAKVKPLEKVAPPWLVDCPLLIYVDIETVANDGLLHSFDDVTALAEKLGEIGAPKDSLVYLTTWSDGGQRRYPTYEPSQKAGGLDPLRRAADALHERGFRLMLHSNVWGCSPIHPDYTRMIAYRVHNRAGHPLSWREFHANNYVSEHVYVRPDCRAFRETFWGSLGPLAEQLSLDGLYLDQAGLLVDDPLADILASTRSLISAIRADQPNLALGGQVLTSRLCDEISLWQLWGTPWSGHGWGQPFRRRSRICADLFRGLTRFCAHMYVPAAVPGRYLWQHEGFSDDLGTVGCFLAAQEDNSYHDAMRCLRLNFRDFGIDPLSAEVIEQARRWAERTPRTVAATPKPVAEPAEATGADE